VEGSEGAPARSLAARLLAEGFAVVDPAGLPANCRIPLLEAEGEARAALRGVWARAGEGLLDPADLADAVARTGRFAVLSGVVTSVGQGRRSAFLNFGPPGRAVSVEVPLTIWRAMPQPAWTARQLIGHRVRARGVIVRKGVPRMLVSHEGALELIE
jgi:hypothetical protein